MKRIASPDPEDLVATWPMPYSATIGSSVRKKGIFLEARAKLPASARKSLKMDSAGLTLRIPNDAAAEFEAASTVVAATLASAKSFPVIPREIQDILHITVTERHRWLKDGRLPSAGTRTVKLRGRARKITFHVFEPHVVEDILDRDLVANWREEDAATAAENRRKAAWNRRLVKASKERATKPTRADDGPQLVGWAEFEREGPL